MLKNKYGNYNLGKGGTQMGTTLQETPSGNRLHIGIFGKTNSGKSAFINAFSGQAVSIVADVKGTTTDPVYKAMEIAPLGPCVLIDTAGFDDEGELGAMRMEKTALAAQKTELALILFASEDMETELEWFRYFQGKKTPVIPGESLHRERKNRSRNRRTERADDSHGSRRLRQPDDHRRSGIRGRRCSPGNAPGHPGSQRPPDSPTGTDDAGIAG